MGLSQLLHAGFQRFRFLTVVLLALLPLSITSCALQSGQPCRCPQRQVISHGEDREPVVIILRAPAVDWDNGFLVSGTEEFLNRTKFLRLSILAPDRGIVLDDYSPMQGSYGVFNPPVRPTPEVRRVIANEAADYGLFWLTGSTSNMRVFHLRTGEVRRMADVRRDLCGLDVPSMLVELEPIGGSPLVAAHCLIFDAEPVVEAKPSPTSRIVIWNFDKGAIWQREFHRPDMQRASMQATNFVRLHPTLRSAKSADHIAIAIDGDVFRFLATVQANGEWSVQEDF